MSADRMDEVTCPYCGWKNRDSWELRPEQDETFEYECGNDDCGKNFDVSVNIDVTYSSRRKGCTGGAHVWKETPVDIDQEYLDRRKKEGNPLYKPDKKPYRFWHRECGNCDEEDFSTHIAIGAPCPPWPQPPTSQRRKNNEQQTASKD